MGYAPGAVLEQLYGYDPAVIEAAAPDLAHPAAGRIEGSFPGEDAHDLESYPIKYDGAGRFFALVSGMGLDAGVLYDGRQRVFLASGLFRV